MLTFFSIAIIILAIGILSYYTSGRFGVKASNTDKMPPYYEHLLQHLKEKEKQGEGIENGVQPEKVFTKR